MSNILYILIKNFLSSKSSLNRWLLLIIAASFISYFLVILLEEKEEPYQTLSESTLSNCEQGPTKQDLHRHHTDIADVYRERGFADDKRGSYRRRPETAHVDCGRILAGDKPYLQSLTGTNRVKIVENCNLNMSCKAIRSRILPSNDNILRPLKHGIAFARIVYKDYEFIEKQVQVSFHPQNAFCFVIDINASEEFKKRMRALAACMPNVIVLADEDPVYSSGHNVNLVHNKCLKALLDIPGWNYALLLQNHDLIMKSVYEMEQIFEWLGGANDIFVTHEIGRVDVKKLKWDPMSLKLFINETEMDKLLLTTPMKIVKGWVHCSLSRASVEWMFQKLDPSIFMHQLNQGRYGVDEQYFPILQANAEFGMPGHFTDECLQQGKTTEFITRIALWVPESKCDTNMTRHAVCIIGLEHFQAVASFTHLMFNKVIPSFDNSIVECTAELLHNRTFLGQVDHPLKEDYYKNMVNVLYHKHHLEPGYKLNCTPRYSELWKE
ncbi:Beta-1,3-galactosyl-O-glycosyl-glycoprotein beta-1,6-N-acetylglucosaminyltransferase 3 [Caenorhabditis elegans]|uniref:Beta-1,3-galactosyl-O-glycosyl-glycoprotein beta-1,6-N-acetylglucosaminyltransferase 3 n=1 Tax=Caenorhabditis elegans TaxID=6239 RepID=O02312_CAEEL|nr:Beta-1,3-galactosyl-O-glycosyl-glycoprotein beta-1,6-N-acetylglucosaminyltransferase 3 [Caenorhabditis elegans]CAB03539.2 Beta-1,3-galactosyl-O-glycosyl-glycoprotein beta-1,6-N-acetylglucosaminyltransferase 3 [Caenorhabditis elegans]|eukprot:NP_493130.2 Uncharacterized protein CELE_T09E11.6 [Caenorhabditis elegans]